MGDLVQIGPHDRMTPTECLAHCALDSQNYQDVIVIGYDKDGALVVRSSSMSRKEAAWLVLDALDHARGL